MTKAFSTYILSAMMMSFANKGKISYIILRVVLKFLDIDRRTRCYGTDEQLFNAEIHMIKAIKENEGLHVTGLANILGVTKGAVSQIIGKLEKKGMILKEKDIDNQSKLILKLTPKGEIAHANHEKYHQQIDDAVKEILEDASEQEICFLRKFLLSLEDKLERIEDKLPD